MPMRKALRRWKARSTAIAGVLAEWNPIELPPEIARTEYDAYANRLHHLLCDGADLERLVNELRRIEAVLFVAPETPSPKLRQIADHLRAAFSEAD